MTQQKISIYQVIPRLFGNKNSNLTLNGSIEQNGCGKFSDFTSNRLKSIKKLGISHIWYTGIIRHATTTNYTNIPAQDSCIVKGKAGSPYAITDYYDVAPDLAKDLAKRMQEFQNLIKRTQKAGLKSIIDFIPNHVSRDYKSIKKPVNIPDLGADDNNQQHFNAQNNYYYLPGTKLELDFCSHQQYTESPAKVSGNDCFHHQPKHTDWYETIKLNYGINVQNNGSQHFSPIPNTWQRMLEILQFWTKKGIDGFRCDMTEMVPVEFWEWVIPQIKAINPKLIFIAEIYQPDLYESYLKKGKFDYLYDKVGLYDTLKDVIREEKPASQISRTWESLNGLDAQMLRFLENHDEQRIASPFFAQDAKKAIPAMLLSATMHQGPIMTYAGQEFGEEAKGESGFSGDDGRSSIFDYWNIPSTQRWLNKKENALNPDELSLREEYKNILNLSISSKVIARGSFYDLMWANKENPHFYHNYIYTYFRHYKGKSLLFVVNFSAKNLEQKIIIPQHALEFAEKKVNELKDICFINIFSKKESRVNQRILIQEGIKLTAPAFGYLVFEF